MPPNDPQAGDTWKHSLHKYAAHVIDLVTYGNVTIVVFDCVRGYQAERVGDFLCAFEFVSGDPGGE